MSIASLLVPLNLSVLDRDWVQDIWYREFLENVDLPPQYEAYLDDIDVNEILHSFTKAAKKWLDSGNDDQDDGIDRTWRSLVHEVKHKELTALLFHLVHKGQKNVLSEDCRVTAILAARTYLTMLMIPGSSVYRIFHSQMFVQCLSCFKFYNSLIEQEYFNDCEDLNLLNRQLKSLLNDLHILIYNVNIKLGDNDSIEETICCLVEFIGNTNVDARLNLDKLILSRLQALALQCIDLLIQNEDDEQPDEIIIKLIFKALLPKFTSIVSTKKAMALWRASGVTYCGALLLKYGPVAIPGFTCLLQHLCYNSEGMERVENRTSRVHLVVGLLSLMPLKPYKEFLQWIVKLSRNAKPQLRLFAVDVLGSLVSGKDRNFEESSEMPDNSTTMNNTVIENPPNPDDIVEPNKDSENTEEINKEPIETPTSSGDTVTEDAEQKDQDEITVPTKHQEVAHRDLLRVVYERCEDISSTVRTKSVSILATFTSPSNQVMKSAINEIFHNDEAILELATKKLKDERVTVRRSAMTLLENVFVNNNALLTKENLEPLVRLCRDTSIMVRCAAISTLTGLATKFSTPIIFDAWLSGPLNQLSDPEVKVQDMVVENDLRNLLLNPLKPYSVQMDISERRPWLLLASITRKNMRRHLARAMGKLARSTKLLNYKLVDILYTHIGTENNLSCWVLLSCVARYIEVADIHFVLDYYNDMNPEQLFGDIRLVSLVLEVLREWSKCIPELDASILRARLIRELCEGNLPAAGARGAVALCVALSKRMKDPSDWAANLVREGEAKMIHSWRNREGELQIQGAAILTVADLQLASDKRPSAEYLELLIDLTGVNDEDNELAINVRACAVAALGKLSIRDRNTASIVAPLCAKLLTTPNCQLPLRVNAMCVLADLCTRFTSIVEPMLPSVCACLGSPDLSVRRCATQLVTQLLVGDFLRLRGSLYFHYFPLTCDKDDTVKDVANYYILNCLVQRNKNILYHNFVECIFYYNRFEGHAVYGKFHVTDEERRLFTLEGDEKRPIRLSLYELMLSHMSDLQRLNTQMKLCKEVSTVGELGTAGMDVLRDAVSCLRRAAKCQQAKQQSEDMAERVAHNIISQKTKLNVVELVVPTVIKLHKKLRTTSSGQSSNISDLQADLVAYACDLLKEYKQEIEELFEADKDLMQEIKFLQDDSGNSPAEKGNKSNRIYNTPAGFDDDDTMLDSMEESIHIMSTPLTSKTATAKSAQVNRRQNRRARNLKSKRSLPLTATI